MKKQVGIWIDHKKAVIVVAIRGEGETTTQIDANIEKRHRQSGESTPADDKRQNDLLEQLRRYYDEVVAVVKASDSIFLFGPGEAKGELKKRLDHCRYTGVISGIEPADKMTGPQIAARVRNHYFGRTDANSLEASGI